MQQLFYIIISTIIVGFVLYEGYTFYKYTYQSVEIMADIKNIEGYEVSRPATKMKLDAKKVVKVNLEYTLEGNTYTKTEKILAHKLEQDNNKIKIWVLSQDPEKCSIKPLNVRRTKMYIALAVLGFWLVILFYKRS